MANDEYRIDSHKLMYHVDRVNDWLLGKDIYPIYAEVSPAGSCNHRCTYCGLDYMGYKARFLPTSVLKERLTEFGRLGLRSVMYAGEGEPFLHRDIADIINHTRASGIDVALTSNGVLFDDKMSSATLSSITWIKISINAGTRDTYAKIHRTKETDFDKVFSNVVSAVRTKNEKGLGATIGMQMILLPENAHEAVILANKAKEAGADYLVIKSYSQHLKSLTKIYEGLDYKSFYALNEELQKIADDRFKVVFRLGAMKKLEEKKRAYDKCRALPFWTYIDAGGGVWACSAYLGDERFYIGSILENTFEDIWKGDKRKKAMALICGSLDINGCRQNCRMDEVNRYLHELKTPSPHVNFI